MRGGQQHSRGHTLGAGLGKGDECRPATCPGSACSSSRQRIPVVSCDIRHLAVRQPAGTTRHAGGGAGASPSPQHCSLAGSGWAPQAPSGQRIQGSLGCRQQPARAPRCCPLQHPPQRCQFVAAAAVPRLRGAGQRWEEISGYMLCRPPPCNRFKTIQNAERLSLSLGLPSPPAPTPLA